MIYRAPNTDPTILPSCYASEDAQVANFLILGGAGFIGSHLCKRLVRHNHRVTVIDSLLGQVHGAQPQDLPESQVKLICADCSGTEWINETITDTYFDCIVSLAAETGSTQSGYMAQQYVRTNVESLALINDLLINSFAEFSQIRKCGKSLRIPSQPTAAILKTRRVLLASSRAVYGEAKLDSDGSPIASQENDEPRPTSIYGATKLAQELLLATGFHGIETCSLRLQNVYGDGQSLSNPYTGVASVFAALALSGKDLHVFGNGHNSRDFIYVEDVIDVFYHLMTADTITTPILNVGTGIRTSIYELAQLIVTQSKSGSKIRVHSDHIVGDISHNFADVSLLRKVGFEAYTALEDGITRLLAWASTQSLGDAENYLKTALGAYSARGLLKG